MDIARVPVQELPARLGLTLPIEYPATSLARPLTEWHMETDDSPIFRYIYRAFRPRRHLEFGTWQGTGVLYCLEECDATVWTLNLLDGEMDDGGMPKYAVPVEPSLLDRALGWIRSRIALVTGDRTRVRLSGSAFCYQTDSHGSIGKFYLERGLGYRVCQIYCDSRKWDTSNYPSDFFDTALIDGGHTVDVVRNDTRKALSVVRSGGIIMWHDYCPDPAVMAQFPGPHDVHEAIEADREWLETQLSDLFWVQPSWILIGVRR